MDEHDRDSAPLFLGKGQRMEVDAVADVAASIVGDPGRPAGVIEAIDELLGGKRRSEYRVQFAAGVHRTGFELPTVNIGNVRRLSVHGLSFDTKAVRTAGHAEVDEAARPALLKLLLELFLGTLKRDIQDPAADLEVCELPSGQLFDQSLGGIDLDPRKGTEACCQDEGLHVFSRVPG